MDPLIARIYFLSIWTIVFTVACYFVGKPKGRETEGVILGLFLTILGLLIVLLLPRKQSWQPSSPAYRPTGPLPPPAPVAWQPQAEAEMAQVRSRFSAHPETPAGMPAGSDHPGGAKLKKLSELLEQGLITAEEYADKRQQILDTI